MSIRTRLLRLGAGLTALAATGGAATLLILGSAGAASAQCNPTTATTGCTTATVNVGQQTTLTDNTNALSWTPVSLPVTNMAATPPGVSLTYSTNAPDGYTITVTSDANFTGTNASNHFPVAGNLTVSGNNTSGFAAFPGAGVSTDMVAVDHSTSAGSGSLTDNYDLSIPNVAPDTYSAALNYVIAANP